MSTSPVVLFAQNTTPSSTISSVGSNGSNGEFAHNVPQNATGHSSPSSIPPPSVSGFVQSVPVKFSIASGIPSPSKSSGNTSSNGFDSGLVPSEYSVLSSTPPLSVSNSFGFVTHASVLPFPIPIHIKSHPVVSSK